MLCVIIHTEFGKKNEAILNDLWKNLLKTEKFVDWIITIIILQWLGVYLASPIVWNIYKLTSSLLTGLSALVLINSLITSRTSNWNRINLGAVFAEPWYTATGHASGGLIWRG